MKRFLAIILFLLALSSQSYATHIVGGNFELTRVRGAQYRLNLILYFDDINGAPQAKDEVIIASIFNKENNALMMQRNLILTQDVFLQYASPACALPNQVRTRKLTYTGTISLSSNVYNNNQGYYIVWERCCRNEVISNIQTPGEVGMVFYMEFPPVDKYTNSAPQYKNIPTEYLCRDQLFHLDFSANDADGDSLVYRLITPMKGNAIPFSAVVQPPQPAPYAPVDWIPPFSHTNAIPGSPSLTIDEQTGILSGVPSNNGLFVFGVVCEEYRDGVKIGEVRRDFQYMIVNCPPNIKPELQIKEIDPPEGEEGFYQEGDTVHIGSLDERCFRLFISDSADVVTISALNVNFPPQFITFTGVATFPNDSISVDSTAQFCISDCADSEDQVFWVDIIVKDQGCPIPLSDTIRFSYTVEPTHNEPPEIFTSLDQKHLQFLVGADTSFTVWGTDPDSGDELTLDAFGLNFNFNETTMSFPFVSGTDSVGSVFYWEMDCEAFKQQSVYDIVFRVQDNSCAPDHQDFDTVRIEIIDLPFEEEEFVAYNFVSPNNDGANDCFILPVLPDDNCDEQFSGVSVYNRWGARVFHDTQKDFSWCPDNHPDGTYYYVVEYTKVVYKGWVQLLR